MLTDLESSEEDSRLNKLFRLRFRIPYLVFKEFLVPMCKDANIFSITEEFRVRVPLEFKILMCLRILSRGNVADDIAELSSGCPSTVNFIYPMHERLFHDAIHWSEWLETIRKDVDRLRYGIGLICRN